MNANELKIINETQNYYEDLLIEKINDKFAIMKTINFSSPTGTGKTKMMADIINKMTDDYYFVITTLSKGQLSKQVDDEISKYTNKINYVVYGLNDYTKRTILQENDILDAIPKNHKIIWFRDEGHINTNRWMEILENLSYRIVNVSATNKYDSDNDVRCNFNHTMMLRTVVQNEGEPEDAIKKLLEVKEQHKNIKNYNPCAIFRILDDNVLEIAIECIEEHNLKYINITDESYDMSDLCRDDNEYDVIINKFKIVEGIDIRRAHVLYMTNEPKNPSTTIQAIGRCRRNALLYRDDIDILAPENEALLKSTRVCYVYYNVRGMHIDEDANGELVTAFCPIISVEQLKSDIRIKLDKGFLANGLGILESNGESGEFDVIIDDKTGFKVLSPRTSFYKDFTKISNYRYICKFNRVSFKDTVYDLSNSIIESETIELNSLNCIKFKDFAETASFIHNKRKLIYFTEENIVDVHKLKMDVPIYPNDFEIALMADTLRLVKKQGRYCWEESKSLTSKINKYTKLSRFISNNNYEIFEKCRCYFYSYDNIIFKSKKLNSMFGYCVEFLSKEIIKLIIDNQYINIFLCKLYHPQKGLALFKRELSNCCSINDYNELFSSKILKDDFFKIRANLVRNCIDDYQRIMKSIYDLPGTKIPSVRYDVLMEETNYTSTLFKYAIKTALFIVNYFSLDPNKSNSYFDDYISCNLSTQHVYALADFIIGDTILDLKCTSSINEKYIKQVLAYHWLSTKHNLNINNVMVYDAIKEKYIRINVKTGAIETNIEK